MNSIYRFIGQTFDRLVVVAIEMRQFRSGSVPYALCRCSCGVEKWIGLSALRSGDTKSCGCKAREILEAARANPKPKKQYPTPTRPYVRTEKGLRQRLEWKRANPQAVKASRERSDAKNPEPRKARKALQDAVRSGQIKRLPCERCGREPAQGHHDDYSKPLVVKWLCSSCHTDLHMAEKKATAATSAA